MKQADIDKINRHRAAKGRPCPDSVVRTYYGRPYPDTSANAASVDFGRGIVKGCEQVGEEAVALAGEIPPFLRSLLAIGALTMFIASAGGPWYVAGGFALSMLTVGGVCALVSWVCAGTVRRKDYDAAVMAWFTERELPPFDAAADTIESLERELEPSPKMVTYANGLQAPCAHPYTEYFHTDADARVVKIRVFSRPPNRVDSH